MGHGRTGELGPGLQLFCSFSSNFSGKTLGQTCSTKPDDFGTRLEINRRITLRHAGCVFHMPSRLLCHTI